MKPISFNTGWTCEPGLGGNIFARGGPQVEPIPVTLPHDATIHEKRTPDAPSGTNKGHYPNGSYMYSKTISVPAEWAEKRVSLEFEGVYMNARVYINSDFAGQCPNGYAGFVIPCNDLLNYGEDNTITVKLHTDQDSRWYAGAGIYRNVKLYVADQVPIAHDGVRLTTLAADAQVASVQADITLCNEGTTRRVVSVSVELLDAEGNVACTDTQSLQITSNATEVLHARLYVRNPKLWSLDEPNLYRAVVRVTEGENVIDESEIETFGIRVLTLDNVRGLAINGQSVKLYGGCIHHDNGILGAATIERAEERRVQKLKSAGYNAIRMAHHPASKALLKACDKYGAGPAHLPLFHGPPAQRPGCRPDCGRRPATRQAALPPFVPASEQTEGRSGRYHCPHPGFSGLPAPLTQASHCASDRELQKKPRAGSPARMVCHH